MNIGENAYPSLKYPVASLPDAPMAAFVSIDLKPDTGWKTVTAATDEWSDYGKAEIGTDIPASLILYMKLKNMLLSKNIWVVR